MNPPSNGIHEFPVEAQSIDAPTVSEPRPLYWSVRRELWENRFIYIAPLIVTAFVLFGSFITMVTAQHRMRAAANDPNLHARVIKPLSMAPAPIMFATLLIGFFYSLDALYGERRDRSILFWKSLPVSDRTTVLSKASIPLVVLPLIAFALSVFTQIALMTLTTPILLAKGLPPGAMWVKFGFFQGVAVMLYGLIVHALWFAPIYGWLMLLSAWVRRAPFLWAVLPVFVVAGVEKIAFNSARFMSFIQYRFTGAMRTAFVFKPDGDIDGFSLLTPGRFLSTPGLWVGLAFAALFLAAAVRLRRNREPI